MFFFFSSRRRHTRLTCDWSSDVCSSDLGRRPGGAGAPVISLVVKDSAAARAGLEVGDVILQVGETAVVTRDAAREALAELAPEKSLRLTVRRDDRRLAVEIAPATR